jgi:hypothetical protein
MNQLRVFVSSTCYDLSQIRADLFDFISNLGYQPVLSEHSSFPINPDNDTINNCIENVKSSDIFILIVGNRYGHVIDNGKSVTNTEYLYAKKIGIPIYVFIYKPIITLLPVWRQNRGADFSNSIDSTLIFDFVDLLRSVDKNWCFEFEKAQDIIHTVRIQFSHLFKGALLIKRKFNSFEKPEFWDKLSANAINVAIKEELLYEVQFFIQVLDDELSKHEDLKLDHEYQILLGCDRRIDDPFKLLDWVSEQSESLIQFINTGTTLLNKAYPKYYGEPGVKSDLKGLYYVACSFARLYKEMITWSINISSTSVLQDFELIRDSLSKYSVLFATRIWDFPKQVMKEILDAKERVNSGESGININVSLTLEVEKEAQEILNSEIDRLVRNYGGDR